MLFVSYHFFATYPDGSGHQDFGNIFLKDTKTPKCEADVYAIETEIQKDIKNRIGFIISSVTVINFKYIY